MASKSSDEKYKEFGSILDRLETNVIQNTASLKTTPDEAVDPASLLENPDNAEVLKALTDVNFGTQNKHFVTVISKVIKDQGLEAAYKLATTPKKDKIVPPSFTMCVLQKTHMGFKAGTTLLVGTPYCYDLLLNQTYSNGQYRVDDFAATFKPCNEDEIRTNLKKIRMLADIDIDRVYDNEGFKNICSMLLPRGQRRKS